MQQIEQLRFLDEPIVRAIAEQFGTPVYVYNEAGLNLAARQVLSFPNAFGLTARFAMKANSNVNILRLFDRVGMSIDASSGYEVERALAAGIAPEKISLTAQELAHNLDLVIESGVHVNATSLRQLTQFGKRFPAHKLGLRFNPGLGSGGINRTNTGGPGSSFGIWHEDVDKAQKIAAEHKLEVTTIHTHIGSGSDPAVWQKAAEMSLPLLNYFPQATVLNLGGGFKVGRMQHEESIDLQEVGVPVRELFVQYAEESGRKIHLEIEPGTYLTANNGSVVSRVEDVGSTGKNGYRFVKIDSGMTEVLRPIMYGAQHPLVVVPETSDNETRLVVKTIVSGHCCESGDILTPVANDPEGLQPRELLETRSGDYLVIEGTGGYCSSMSSKNYNSFPEAAEVLYCEDGSTVLIRKKQTLEQMTANEIAIEL